MSKSSTTSTKHARKNGYVHCRSSHMIMMMMIHIGPIWRIWLNNPCSAAMQAVAIITLETCQILASV